VCGQERADTQPDIRGDGALLITVGETECYFPNGPPQISRLDLALYECMESVRQSGSVVSRRSVRRIGVARERSKLVRGTI
jgi:hypothetical protein